MPRYASRNTEVQLCVWDPSSQLPTTASSSHSNQLASFNSRNTAKSASTFDKGASEITVQSTSDDPAYPCEVIKLKEGYFKDHEGVDFLGVGMMPFYLVRAGSNLFSTTKSVGQLYPLKPLDLDKPGSRKTSGGSSGSPLSSIDSSLFTPTHDIAKPDFLDDGKSCIEPLSSVLDSQPSLISSLSYLETQNCVLGAATSHPMRELSGR
jgi:hypothetical protein